MMDDFVFRIDLRRQSDELGRRSEHPLGGKKLLKRIKILSYEVGIVWRDRELVGLITEGKHWFFDPLFKLHVEKVSKRETWFSHEKLDLIMKSDGFKDHAQVVDLKAQQHALVWVDGRFSHVLPPGTYAYWKGQKQVDIEIVDGKFAQFEHAELNTICKSVRASNVLDICMVGRDRQGVLFVDGDFVQSPFTRAVRLLAQCRRGSYRRGRHTRNHCRH